MSRNRLVDRIKLFLSAFTIIFCLVFITSAFSQDTTAPGYNRVRDEGTNLTRRRNLNMVGAGVSCADDSSNGETDCTISGGGSGNSFETIDVPAGTDPVAESSTDTLTITETTTPLVITGTAATDTIDITWTTLGADQGGTGATSLTDGGILLGSGTGAITALGVATNGQIPIGDGTTDPVLATLTESTALDVANGVGTITLSWDSTEVEATTWGAGGNASNLWTFNLSGTDPTLNWVSGGATLVGTFTADALTLGAEENLTLGSSTIQEDTTTSDVTINNDVDIEDATPHLRLTDTTTAHDDFEWYADANQVYLTNVTDAVELFRFDNLYNFFFRGGGTTYSWPTSDGTSGQVLQTNGAGVLSFVTSSGTGDITDVWSIASGDVNQPVIGTGEFLDGGTATADGTSEGILLPRGTTTTSATSEGQVSWDTDDDELRVGTGSIAMRVGGFMVSGGEITTPTTTFDVPFGFTDNADINQSHIPINMTCRNLYAYVSTAPGAGTSHIVTITDDGVDSGTLTCTIADTNTTCNDTTNATGSMAAGSLVEFVYTESGAAATPEDAWATVWCYPDGN